MNKTIELLKIASLIPKRYFKAKQVLKSNDYIKEYEFIKEVINEANDAFKMEVEIINLNDNFDFDGCFMFANHQDNLDIYALVYALNKPVKFIAKKELFDIPLFKTYMKLSDSYSLDRNNPRQGVKVFKDALKDVNTNGSNIVIFPEGTRCKSPLMLEFNSGLFNIIRRSEKPLVPVYIEYDKDNFKKVKIVIGQALFSDVFKSLSGVRLRDLIYDKIAYLKKEYGSRHIKYNVLGFGDSITFGEDSFGNYENGYFDKFIAHLEKEGLLNKVDNLAVPGITIDDCFEMIEYNNYNEIFERTFHDNFGEFQNKSNKSINELIKETDYLVMSVGANDVLKLTKKSKVDMDEIYQALEEIYKKTDKLIKKLLNINPKINIIMIGLYFPYPHSKGLDKFNKVKVLDLYYQKLENKYKNLRCPSISKEVATNKENYLPNPYNIHLSDEGYTFVTSKVIAAFQSFYK